jgi:PAS domain S-box-containing protein
MGFQDRHDAPDGTAFMESLDRLGVGYCRSDASGRIVAVNAAGAHIYGYTPEEMVAGITTLDTNVSEEERYGLAQAIEQKGTVTRFAVPGRHQSGRLIFVSTSIHALRDESGQTIGYEGVFSDSTSQVELERQSAEALEELRRANARMARLSEFQDRFLSALSHDLQTPPVVIQGVSELLLRGHYGPLLEAQDKAVRTIHRNVLQLSHMMEQLLQFSRLINDRSRGTQDPVPLQESLDRALAEAQAEWKDLFIRCSVEKPEGVLMVAADPPSLDFLVKNVLLNAGSTVRPGYGIRCLLEDRGGTAHLRVVAEPAKPNLPAATRLLQKFFLLPARGEEEQAGSIPIGLAAGCYVARLLLGDLTVETSQESGFVLTLTLPLARPGVPPPDFQTAPRTDERASRARTSRQTARKVRSRSRK